MKERRVDWGNFDWVVAKDNDGNVWIRPSIDWKDGEVYETMQNGQAVYREIMTEMDRI